MSKDNNQDVFPKTSINWYPGHMAKTKRQIAEDIKLIDVVIEILDARMPISSQNPDIGKLLYNKKRIVALNKSDLANEEQNKRWKNHFENIRYTLCNNRFKYWNRHERNITKSRKNYATRTIKTRGKRQDKKKY